MTQTAAISLHRNKYSQELHYYPFAVKLGRRIGSCNTLNDLFNKICVANNTKDFNLDLLSIIIERNESKTLTKHTLITIAILIDVSIYCYLVNY